MECPRCKAKLKAVKVSVFGANSKTLSYQCPKCDYFEFEPQSSKKVLGELKDVTLSIEHKVIKLSKDRLGMYFNKDIIKSIGLKNGETFNVFVPDRKHIVLELKSKI